MIKAARRTGLVFFPAFDWAISPTHPERGVIKGVSFQNAC